LIEIELNGELISIEKSCLADFLKTKNKLAANFAVAVNELFIAKSNYSAVALQNGDKVELVVPMQGG
jgi:sulfur carrier protein